jgi:hypothetical protein
MVGKICKTQKIVYFIYDSFRNCLMTAFGAL